jgi:hypothetical protein
MFHRYFKPPLTRNALGSPDMWVPQELVDAIIDKVAMLGDSSAQRAPGLLPDRSFIPPSEPTSLARCHFLSPLSLGFDKVRPTPCEISSHRRALCEISRACTWRRGVCEDDRGPTLSAPPTWLDTPLPSTSSATITSFGRHSLTFSKQACMQHSHSIAFGVSVLPT